MKTATYAKSCQIYCEHNPRTENIVVIIQAFLAGYTPRDVIIENLCPSLSLRTVQYYFNLYSGAIANAK